MAKLKYALYGDNANANSDQSYIVFFWFQGET